VSSVDSLLKREHPIFALPDSLRVRLPLLIGVLIVAVLTAFLWVTNDALKGIMERTGGERAQVAADQIAGLLVQTSRRTMNQMRRLAGTDPVVAYLRNPTDRGRTALYQELQPLTAAGQPPVLVMDAAGHVLAEVAGPSTTTSIVRLPTAAGVPARVGVSPFQILDGHVFSESVVEVFDRPPSGAPDEGNPGTRPVGFLVARRTLTGAQTGELISGLVGNGALVSIGNQSGDVWTDLSRQVPAPAVDMGRRATAQYQAADRQWRLGGLSPVADTPWSVWVEFPRALVLAPAAAVVDRMQWLALAFVVVTVVLVAALTRRLTKPLHELTRAAEGIAAGEYSGRVAIRRRDEIGRLSVAFNTMSARVHQAHRELEERVQQRTERLEMAMTELDQFFSLSGDLLCIADTEGRFTRVNAAWQEALGWTTDDLTAVPFSAFIHPDDQAATSAEVAKLAEGHATETFENRYRCKDGSYRWLQWKATPGAGRNLVYAAARDVTEHKRLTTALEDGMVELADANSELEAFSYSVSHDLRAPLRHITGFAAFLERAVGASLDEQARRYLQTITDAASRMGHLIDDLLAFSRMARADLVKQRLSLGDLVSDVQSELATGTEGREIVWTVHPLPVVDADRSMLRLVLVNLLSNALKYTATRSQAQVEIGVNGRGPGETVVFVRDNGVGFDMQYAHKLFGVFQRLHGADEFEGTGIGLANVRRIVHRHGGRTWAEGVVNSGATFYFSLPSTN
jgi:PAS domain S-box-containing protein